MQSAPPALDFTVREYVLIGRNARMSPFAPAGEADRTAVEKAMEYVMLGLRTARGIEAGEYERRYRAPFAPLETLLQGYVRMGLAKQVDDRWRFTPRGFLLSNQLIGELLDAQAEQRYKP